MGQRLQPPPIVEVLPPAAARVDAERLAGHCFRRAMIGLEHGDPAGMVFVWQLLASAAGGERADGLAAGVGRFARAVSQSAARRIEVLPAGCPGLCRDECLAVSIIAACQHDQCPALKACVFALIASSHVEPVVAAARPLAEGLAAARLALSPSAICNAAVIPAPASRLPA